MIKDILISNKFTKKVPNKGGRPLLGWESVCRSLRNGRMEQERDRWIGVSSTVGYGAIPTIVSEVLADTAKNEGIKKGKYVHLNKIR